MGRILRLTAQIPITKSIDFCIFYRKGQKDSPSACRPLAPFYQSLGLILKENGDLLFLQNEINNLPYIINQAYKLGLRILFNPSPYRDELKKLDFNKLYGIILNQLEAAAFSNEEDALTSLKVLHERYPHLHIVITLGKNGCIYHNGQKTYIQPAYSVKPVDTTAAGDTFSGYFVSGLYRGECPEVILNNATAAAAIATTRKGAAPSIPTRSEVENFLLSQLKLS